MSNSIDQQFVEFVVKSLVGNPDAVQVERTIDEKGVLLELTVDPEDLGRVIGKRGATAQSLRTLLRALGTKNEARYNLKIVDNGEPRPEREESQAPSKSSDDAGTTDTAQSSAKADDDDDLFANVGKDDHSDAVSRTRKELEDLDDLDI
jgi:predicted RNA-binding protein YlqC (UPF0109 family)